MTIDASVLNEALLTLAQEAGAIANFCDHAEHAEDNAIGDVRAAARRLRATGVALCEAVAHDPVALYRNRLRQIERRNVLFEPGGFDAAEHIEHGASWRELQLLQIAHDREYHPDVLGLPKLEQIRHFALHVAKLAGAVAGAIKGEVPEADLVARRIPDMLIFGVKLSTVSAERLPDEPVASSFRRYPFATDRPSVALG